MELLEATHRYAKRSLTSATEAKLKKQMAKAFLEQGKIVSKGFARLAFLFSEAVSEDDLDPLFTKAELATAELMEGSLTKAQEKAMTQGARALIAEFNVALSFSLTDPLAQAYLQTHGAALVSKINETTRDFIRTLVANAQAEGWSYTKTAEELIHRYKEFAVGKPQLHIDSRAHFIAVTETGNAYMEGQWAVVDQMAGTGLDMEKSWLTMGDDRVSEGCEENEAAGWIPYDEPFPSGHQHPLRFPGCRCDMETRMKEPE